MATGNTRPFAVRFNRPLGKEVEPSDYKPLRDLVLEASRTNAGNLVLRIVREQEGGTLEQCAYVVMSEAEARDLYTGIADLFPDFKRG